MRPLPAILVLADGTVFHGQSIGAAGRTIGEVVFNTAMTGYQEILTDPSYARQIVTLTYPHIGNTGINDEDVESRGIFAAGLVTRNYPKRVSNWRATRSLSEYLNDNSLVAISDIDTRMLTRLIRIKGAQSGCIAAGESIDVDFALAEAKSFPGLQGMDLACEVSVKESYNWNGNVWSLSDGYTRSPPASFKVVAYDFGIKHNILRLLSQRGCDVTVVPAQTPSEKILVMQPDGVFLSNGPGDPEPCAYAIKAIQEIIDTGMPTFGICLGHQLLALASGARTMKMKFGHHGANHPVKNLDTGVVAITSQNHGFAVDENNVPDNLRVTHRSLFDNTIQGLERTDRPAFSFQGHPEASPGPHDIDGLFDRFIALMENHRGIAQQSTTGMDAMNA
ncbi:MAG: glutamine-hydrolyzing carbamoyl-phosphate synthase small subunit [Gammaproteobacteria bacterium]|nr:glutamine-hydrolyzing carbamoyl-phosphate synthase small subunit [Gammaproteobacteria bacterium]